MAQSNIYGAGAASVFELFSDYLDGDASRAALVLGSARPSDAAANALDKSLAAFGYGEGAFTVATTTPLHQTGEDVALDPQAVFLLVEGLDPLLLVCIDAATTHLVGQAYRTQLAPDSAGRAFGRPTVAFGDLDELIRTEAGKQKAWKLLKSLPRR